MAEQDALYFSEILWFMMTTDIKCICLSLLPPSLLLAFLPQCLSIPQIPNRQQQKIRCFVFLNLFPPSESHIAWQLWWEPSSWARYGVLHSSFLASFPQRRKYYGTGCFPCPNVTPRILRNSTTLENIQENMCLRNYKLDYRYQSVM